MTPRSLALPLLALACVTACTTEATPTAPPVAAAPSVSPPTSDGAAVVDTDAVLEVEDQVSKGPTVNVAAAAVTEGGWVVVSADGGRNVLGAGEVAPGTAAITIQVSLADIITEPTELIATLYQDTVADGLYGAGDLPVSNDDADDDDTPAGERAVFQFTGADVS